MVTKVANWELPELVCADARTLLLGIRAEIWGYVSTQLRTDPKWRLSPSIGVAANVVDHSYAQ